MDIAILDVTEELDRCRDCRLLGCITNLSTSAMFGGSLFMHLQHIGFNIWHLY